MNEFIIDYLPCGDISELDLDQMMLENSNYLNN